MKAPMTLIGIGHSEPKAKPEVIDKYREQMKTMFGNSKLPAVVYKGETIPAREL